MAKPRREDAAVVPARLLRTSPGDWATPGELDRLDALCALLPDRRAADELRHVAGHMAYYRIMLTLPADYDPTAAEIEEWRGTARRLLVTERRRRTVREWAAAAGIGADEAFGRVELAPYG